MIIATTCLSGAVQIEQAVPGRRHLHGVDERALVDVDVWVLAYGLGHGALASAVTAVTIVMIDDVPRGCCDGRDRVWVAP